MESPESPNDRALDRRRRVVALAEDTRLYLNLTGLGCYHKADTPEWYDALDEAARWQAQARFWSAIARAVRGSPALFCYDLMNEPVIDGKRDQGWRTAGYFSIYWGRTIEEYAADTNKLSSDLIGGWLQEFRRLAATMNPP